MPQNSAIFTLGRTVSLQAW